MVKPLRYDPVRASHLAKYPLMFDIQEFGPTLKRHHLLSLPPYLILHIKRFTKNNFVEERNPTVVNFPLRGVELSDCEFLHDPLSIMHDELTSIFRHRSQAFRSTAYGL